MFLNSVSQIHLTIFPHISPDKSNDTDASLPSWLKVSDTTSCLLPGQRFNITFTAKIDHALAEEIMIKYKNKSSIRKVPVDIIIMHVVEGCDIFLTVFFELLPSCFGTSFEQMCKLKKPLAKCRINDLDDREEEEVVLRRNIRISVISDDLTAGPSVNRKIPVEIFRLIDYLYKKRMQTKYLLTVNKPSSSSKDNEFDDVEINVIRDYLDSWGTGPFPGTPEAAFGTLLKMFEMSPVPLLTITDREITATNNRFDLSKDLIMHKVCPLHRRIFLYLCLFIQEMRIRSSSDKSTDFNIGKKDTSNVNSSIYLLLTKISLFVFIYSFNFCSGTNPRQKQLDLRSYPFGYSKRSNI